MKPEDIIKDLQRMHTYWLERNEGPEYRACRNAIIHIEAQARVVEAAQRIADVQITDDVTTLQNLAAAVERLGEPLDAIHDLGEGEKG